MIRKISLSASVGSGIITTVMPCYYHLLPSVVGSVPLLQRPTD